MALVFRRNMQDYTNWQNFGTARLWDEVRRTDERLRKSGKRHHRFLDLLDTPDELPWSGAGRVISDDHPLVEYPGVAGWLIEPPGEPASR